MNLNKVFICGNLTKDPELRTLPSGQPVASFNIATNSFFTKDGQRTQKAEFHKVVIFGKMAEVAKQYLIKGSIALIEGRIQTRSWNDKSGAKRWSTEIVAENLQLGPKSQGQQTESAPEESNLDEIQI